MSQDKKWLIRILSTDNAVVGKHILYQGIARRIGVRWSKEYFEHGVEKVIQGSKTESVPLGELKKLAEERMLIFDQLMMKFTMGNCIALIDNNGNRKLSKARYDQKIDSVAAMMDAYVAFKLNREMF